MTDITAPKFTERNFVALDGGDGQGGPRAEVYVEKNRGKITEIKVNEKTGTADVRFEVEGYQHPMHGWIPVDEPAFQEAQRAHGAGEEVAFRIELQRKKNIDRTIPIMEIRERQRDKERPGIKLLVELNGVQTREGLTNPNEDPVGSGGAMRATDTTPKASNGASGGGSLDPQAILSSLSRLATQPGTNQAILDSAVAQAVVNGVELSDALAAVIPASRRDDTQPAPQAYFSNEAQAWKLYNTDGRLNLGSYVVAAAVGAENLAYQQLAAKGALVAENRAEALSYFTNVILGLADRAQVVAQGEGSHSDRGAQSHTRIRGILYTLIEHEHNLPVTVSGGRVIVDGGNAGMKAWMASVGGETVRRFKAAVEASLTTPRFGLPASLGGEAVASAPSAPAPEAPMALSAQAPTPEPASAPEAAKVASAPAPTAVPASTPVVPAGADKNSRMEAARAILEAPLPTREEEESYPVDAANSAPVIASGLVFPRNDVSGDADSLKAGADTQEAFKEMLTGNGFDIQDRADQVRAGAILKYTFGVAKVSEIPEEDLLDFIDHYVATGPEGLQAALEEANKQ